MKYILVFLFLLPELTAFSDPALKFREDFEGTLDRWTVTSTEDVVIRDLDDPAHRHVLTLIPNGNVYALITGSEEWGGVRIEGEVLFPTDEDNYLGVIYNFRQRDAGADFGLIYIKGNGNYLEVNPHRDFNVGRTLYPEYHTPLNGEGAIRIGEWQKFMVEVLGSECHFYVGNMTTPQLTFSYLELDSGAIGLQPRSVGGAVYIDNVVVHSIDRFSYKGPARPMIRYDAAASLSRWEVSGPYDRNHDELASETAGAQSWRRFPTDGRGAVVTGIVADYQGPQDVAYFKAEFQCDKEGKATLHLSTVDDLALWVNGRFHGFIPRGNYAWFDYYKNPEHEGQRIPIPVRKGNNRIVLRVNGGIYATGGFYSGIEQPCH